MCTQSWVDARVHVPEPFRSSGAGHSLSSHPGSNRPTPLSQAPMGPPLFQSRHSQNGVPSTDPDTNNRCEDEDVSFDIGNGNQDDDASFYIGNANQSMDASFNTGNGNQDDEASIEIGNGNRGRDASFNVHDGIQNGRDAIDGVDAQVLELA
jgi:hypothetical protein